MGRAPGLVTGRAWGPEWEARGLGCRARGAEPLYVDTGVVLHLTPLTGRVLTYWEAAVACNRLSAWTVFSILEEHVVLESPGQMSAEAAMSLPHLLFTGPRTRGLGN